MIIGLSGGPVEIGSTIRIDFIRPPHFYEDVPVMILRQATAEEYLRQKSDEVSEEEARKELQRRLDAFPDAVFYEVSMD